MLVNQNYTPRSLGSSRSVPLNHRGGRIVGRFHPHLIHRQVGTPNTGGVLDVTTVGGNDVVTTHSCCLLDNMAITCIHPFVLTKPPFS